MAKTIEVWVTDFGEIPIDQLPEDVRQQYRATRITKRGWPDQRYKASKGLPERIEEYAIERFGFA